MATGDVMRVTLVGSLSGEPTNFTFGIVEGAGSGSDPNPLVNLAQDVATNVVPGFLTGFSVNQMIHEVVVSDVQPGTAGAVHIGVAEQGDVNEDNAPQVCACVVSWQTLLRGPMNRGRMFLCGLLHSHTISGYWMSDGQDVASAAASKIFDPYGADGTNYQLNVLSYVPGSSPRALRAAVPITGFHIVNTIKVQRRRGVGVRIHRRRTAP